MDFFHGTSKASRIKIEGPPANIDIRQGGGEMGQGFYLGDNLTLAIAWAKGRYKNPGVLKFGVNNSAYAGLAFKQMSHRQVLNTWQQLKRLRTHRTHTFGSDVVFGPLATAPYAGQYKFESKNAENLLNNSTTTNITRII